MDEMTSMERVKKTMFHEEPDRVPIFFAALTFCARLAGIEVREYSTNGKSLASAQLNFLKTFDVDAVFAMSDVAATADSFGCVSKFYDGQMQTPAIAEHVVKDWRDWEKVKLINPWKDGRVPPLLEACKIMKDKLGDSVPVIGIIPSPITCATWLEDMSGVLKDVKRHPEELKKALTIIAESSLEIGKAYIASGADALIMIVTRSTRDIFTDKQYEEFGKPYDLQVLNGLTSSDKPLMLHVCGVNPMLEMLVNDYPVVAINWWDRGTSTSMKDAKERYGDMISLIGGLDQTKELLTGTPAEVDAQAKDAIQQGAKGGGLMLCSGCELSAISPFENVHAAVNAAKKYGRYPIAL